VYAAHDLQSDSTALKSTCKGFIRCLDCAKYLDTLTTSVKWDNVSDNAAIEDDKFVCKIFDNRFHPTYRKPDAWMRRDPWIAPLKVDSDFFLFQESESVDKLGHPSRKRERGDDDLPNILAYPTGSVRIIKYSFVNGTHFASKVSHFQEIARCIKEMHNAGIIHGDVRGFNVLHPHPTPVEGNIEKSLLIDFNLCGAPGDKYPPGYSTTVTENKFTRRGTAKRDMKMCHDWYELASAMAPYNVGLPNDQPSQKAWSDLYLHFVSKADPDDNAEDFAGLIDRFIKSHGDLDIQVSPGDAWTWNEENKRNG
jgi:hypothetical protein